MASTALRLQAEPDTGCLVIATARRAEALAELSDIGMSTVVLDVNDQDSIARAKAEVDRLTDGRLDILVNNAYMLLEPRTMVRGTAADMKQRYDLPNASRRRVPPRSPLSF